MCVPSTNTQICCCCCFTGNVSWPTGKYGLPMPKAGCPNNWFDGRRFHDDTNANLIERKVHESLHLAGWVSKEGITDIS